MQRERRTNGKAKRLRRAAIAGALLIGGAIFAREADAHLRATSLLLHFADPKATGALAEYGNHPLEETRRELVLPNGRTVAARTYAPIGVSDAPGVIIVHGVHRLGIEEPRLQRFARSIAALGVRVLTPQVDEIAEYRIDPASIATIGGAAHVLREELGGRRVGVMGMSFAGGLGLLAAADPAYADDVKLVVAVGAHDDLSRVARYFATSEDPRPDGSIESLKAHQYGALVLVYGYVDSFFSKEDAPIARDAIRAELWEQRETSKKLLEGLSPQGKATLGALFAGDVGSVREELLARVKELETRMREVSPSGRLGGLRAQTFLLHGEEDSVIPAAETLWLARDVPEDKLGAAIVSPAIQHVEIHGEPSLADQWALVHFMARVLEAAG